MEWISVDEAKKRRGLRVVLQYGGWALWGACAKNVFYVKNLAYARVPQHTAQENLELVAWTGVRNQPQVIYDDDPVRTGWLEILNLAERLAPAPALLPDDPAQRAVVVGLSNELLGEWGLGWCKRIQFSKPLTSQGTNWDKLMKTTYGLKGDDMPAQAERRIVAILRMFADRLHHQKRANSPYLVGEQLTAADIYWATTSNLVRPLPHDLCALSDGLRNIFGNPGAGVEAAIDPILIEHRDYIYKQHLELPVDLS